MSDPAASITPTLADPQDPLPESNWVWRRAFIFLFSAAFMVGIWFKVDDLGRIALGGNETAIRGLITLLKWSFATLGSLFLLYLVAPSAEQVVKMLATLSAWKAGVSTSSVSRAIAPDGGRAEASTTSGPAAAVPAPPASPALPNGTGLAAEMPWRKVNA